MLSLHLHPIFKARGIARPYSFLVKSGFTYHAAANLTSNRYSTINLAYIDKLCILLHCTPNDLLVYTPEPNQILADNHPLKRLSKQDAELNWLDSIKTLPIDQLKEIVKIINTPKTDN
jgi:hypothetical protein